MTNFNPPLFIEDGDVCKFDPQLTPYLYNNNGYPLMEAKQHAGSQLVNPATDLLTFLGSEYYVKEHAPTTDSWHNQTTQFEFSRQGAIVDEVEYQPMWATDDACRHFGITLLKNGTSLKLDFANPLEIHQYTYGIFAGFQSPYIGSERKYELLPVNATDFECHEFPHVFCSQREYPLVISVARYWKQDRKILLADLWVLPGDMLYVPPKKYSKDTVYIDLHGNRNSARACMEHDGVPSLLTQTLLAKDIPSNFFYEKKKTRHLLPHQ